MAEATIEVPPFIVAELSGRRRTVKLVGRGLPYRPLSFEGEQRVKVTFPAGNPFGFGTVMGPTEGETEISGAWKDKYLLVREGEVPPIRLIEDNRTAAQRNSSRGDNQADNSTGVSSAFDAVRLFDSIRQSGQVVLVSWGNLSRRGYLKKFTHKWNNIHDCEWSATFVWTAQGEITQSTDFGPPAGLGAAGGNLRDLLNRMSRVLTAPQRLLEGPASQARNALNRLSSISYEIDETLAGLRDTADPANFVNQIRSTLGAFASSGENIRDLAESSGSANLFRELQGRSLRTQANQDAALDAIDPGAYFQAELYTRETISDAQRLRDAATAQARALETGPEATLGIYYAREGDDLRDVARLYYDDPNQWRALLLHNNLINFELYPGQPIVVPRLNGQRPDGE